jgi:site-specific DNA-methyltransferase (adenine-specific)
METNKIINGDCIDVMSKMPEGSVDLVLCSPPYNCAIKYDIYDDTLSMEDYWIFTKKWLKEALRVLKDDGRIAINIPIEMNVKERGGRFLFNAEFYAKMMEVGFKYFGTIDLSEDSAHRIRKTAWGSWMSPSQPYIYNPKECILMGYKKSPKKLQKGEPHWVGVPTEIEQEDGTIKTKVVYKDEDKKEFMNLVFGEWQYFADTKQMTKATFSMDIPTKAIKILSYKNDIVLDPFAGSGTSCVAAETLGRRWIGIELSENYAKVARDRVRHFIDQKSQLKIEGLI